MKYLFDHTVLIGEIGVITVVALIALLGVTAYCHRREALLRKKRDALKAADEALTPGE